ncbi:hypothetical protein F6Y05_37210 [Bacillus megaterium]|nr:hypothetical protein [Priestia megaterium]
MQLIKLSPDYTAEFKSEIPEDTKNKIYAMFNQLNVVKYYSSDHEIVDVNLTNKKWEVLYPKRMFAQFSEINNGCILQISGARVTIDNEIILGAHKHPMFFKFKVIL